MVVTLTNRTGLSSSLIIPLAGIRSGLAELLDMCLGDLHRSKTYTADIVQLLKAKMYNCRKDHIFRGS